LASKIPALAARQLPHDWQPRYHLRPVLFETFIETHVTALVRLSDLHGKLLPDSFDVPSRPRQIPPDRI